MKTTKKYRVSPSTDNWSSANNNRLITTSKKEADARAKLLFNAGLKVNYGVDTYENGVCIRNEEGYYEKGKIRVYSTIDYKPKKKQKAREEDTFSMFFAEEDLKKWGLK